MTSTRTSDEVHHDYKLNMKQIRSSPRQHEGDIARPNNKPPASQFTGKPSTLWPKRDPPYMDGLPVKGRPHVRYHATKPPSLAVHSDEPAEIPLLSSRGSIGISS